MGPASLRKDGVGPGGARVGPRHWERTFPPPNRETGKGADFDLASPKARHKSKIRRK